MRGEESCSNERYKNVQVNSFAKADTLRNILDPSRAKLDVINRRKLGNPSLVEIKYHALKTTS